LQLDIEDDSGFEISKYWESAFKFIDKGVASGGKVLVHCLAGVSRSPTMVLGYIMYRYGVPLKQALEIVTKARPVIAPNLGFVKQLRDLEKSLLK